ALIDAVTAALPSSPLPPPLCIPPPIDLRDDTPETEMPPRKRSCLFALGSSKVGYGIRDTWVNPAEVVPKIAPMTLGEVNTKVTELAELHEHDTQDLYALLEDAQDSSTRILQRVSMYSQLVELLMRDRMTLQKTVWIVREEAYASREAWAHLIGLSQTVYSELQTYREQVRIMAPVTRQGLNAPPNDTNPNNMTPESVQAMINQAMINQALCETPPMKTKATVHTRITEGTCKLHALVSTLTS
nr:hypothetical protein [Tanacetum cinerariifolium]